MSNTWTKGSLGDCPKIVSPMSDGAVATSVTPALHALLALPVVDFQTLSHMTSHHQCEVGMAFAALGYATKYCAPLSGVHYKGTHDLKWC